MTTNVRPNISLGSGLEPRTLNVEVTTPNKRVFVHHLFTTIAPRYDWFNRLASLNLDQGWRRRAVARSGVAQGMDVLDVCTGTGDLALLCAERLQGNGRVVGLDFNQAMLASAARKARAKRLHVGWLLGDAQTLPFPAARFDRVLIGFSTRNLSDLRRGIREVSRVLKPKGRLVVLETGRPSGRMVRAGYLVFLGTVARLIGFLLTGRCWPFTYLAKSVKGFLRPFDVVELMNACGLAASYQPLSFGLASLYLAVKPDHEGPITPPR